MAVAMMYSSSLFCQNIGLRFSSLANVLLFPNIHQQIFVTTFIYAFLVLQFYYFSYTLYLSYITFVQNFNQDIACYCQCSCRTHTQLPLGETSILLAYIFFNFSIYFYLFTYLFLNFESAIRVQSIP